MTTDSESVIKSRIRKRLSKLGIVIWNNASGQTQDDEPEVCPNCGCPLTETKKHRAVHYGLCRGSSDLVGVRKLDGKFTVVEVKTIAGMARHAAALNRALAKNAAGKPLTTEERRAFEQAMFVRLVLDSNGLAGFAASEDEAERIVTK